MAETAFRVFQEAIGDKPMTLLPNERTDNNPEAVKRGRKGANKEEQEPRKRDLEISALRDRPSSGTHPMEPEWGAVNPPPFFTRFDAAPQDSKASSRTRSISQRSRTLALGSS